MPKSGKRRNKRTIETAISQARLAAQPHGLKAALHSVVFVSGFIATGLPDLLCQMDC
jgi:hypothetical protein